MENLIDITAPNLNRINMSLKILMEDQIDKLFKENKGLHDSHKNKFEIAVAHFANLRYLHGIDWEDLIDGIVGEGGDEGIDLCFIFCNGVLVKDDKVSINSESKIRVKFFQIKKEDSFTVDGFRNLKEGIEETFSLDLNLKTLKKIGANNELIEKVDLIRKVFRKAKTEAATFVCDVFYVTAAPEINIAEKITHLEKPLKNNNLGIDFNFEYWGAQKLLDLTKKYNEKLEIKFDTQIINYFHKASTTNGICGFVSGNDLMNSLIDGNNNFKSHLTEGNIRFFLGEDKKINKSIIETATDPEKSSTFWAMNNGITIIGENVNPVDANVYNIQNPQIVNGCQTIHCLHYAYKQDKKLPESLKVFVKLIDTGDDINKQTDIISATNSQNSVKAASLKANDDIQKNIESHLKKYDIYYERRENYYKAKGFIGMKVIGLLKMAQVMHTVINKESIVAINDTATLFSNNKYKYIFNKSSDYDLYAYGVKLYQKLWTLKSSDLRKHPEYSNIEKDLISKGGFIFLHIVSTLMFCDAEYVERGQKVRRNATGPFMINLPVRKNAFSVRRQYLMKKLDDDDYMEEMYIAGKKIFKLAARKYSVDNQDRLEISLFKSRPFDKDYVRPAIEKYLKAKEKII